MQASELLHVQPWLRRPSARIRLRRLREQADRWIERGYYGDPADPRVAWRVQELTSERERLGLARSVKAVLKSLPARWLPGASPVNRAALRPHAALLAAIGDRLADTERSVSAAGVLGVRRLLADPDGPLYARPWEHRETTDVGIALRTALRRLEP